MLMPRSQSLVLVRCVFFAVFAFSAAGCWSPQHAADTWVTRAVELSEEKGALDLAGLGPFVTELRPDAESVAEPGDAVSYAVDVDLPGESYRRIVRLTVLPFEGGKPRKTRSAIKLRDKDGHEYRREFRAVAWPVKIELFDAEQKLLGSSTLADVGVDNLYEGLAEVARLNIAAQGSDERSEEVVQSDFESLAIESVVCLTFGAALSEDDTLRGLALDIVDSSLLITALWNFEVAFTFDSRSNQSEEAGVDPLTGLPSWRLPMQLTINGRPAIRLVNTVVDPLRPIGLSAGLVRVDGFRASDDRYRFRAQLITAPHN